MKEYNLFEKIDAKFQLQKTYFWTRFKEEMWIWGGEEGDEQREKTVRILRTDKRAGRFYNFIKLNFW